MSEDIRNVKQALRDRMKDLRLTMPPEDKAAYDEAIRDRFLGRTSYLCSATVLTYVSTPLEVDTRGIIEAALADGKQVACPRCIDGTRQMAFYYITSPDELIPRTFGVPEPEADPARLFRGARNPICIVPGLAFDRGGYRLGYGKGYYDRFLSGYDGWTVGLCYDACVEYRLPHGRFDRTVDRLITERYVRNCKDFRSRRTDNKWKRS